MFVGKVDGVVMVSVVLFEVWLLCDVVYLKMIKIIIMIIRIIILLLLIECWSIFWWVLKIIIRKWEVNEDVK